MALENFYDDAEAVQALQNEVPQNVPETILTNPFFDDEPEEEAAPGPSPEPRRPEPPAPEPARESAEPEPEAPRQEPRAPAQPVQPQVQQQPIDPQALGQAIAYAMQANQPPPAPPKEEDFDPPEVDIDEEAILEGRASLKKALREAQVTTARSLRKQFEDYNQRYIYPQLQRAQGVTQYLQYRAPLDAETAKATARSQIVRSGLVGEDQVDELLEQADQAIGDRWDYRMNPRGWEAAARLALSQGNLPVRQKTKPQPGAGKGDARPPKAPAAKNNPYVKLVGQMMGKPLSEESLEAFDQKFGGAR